MQKKHQKNPNRKSFSKPVTSGIHIRAGIRAGQQCTMSDGSPGSVPLGAPAQVCCNKTQCDFLE
jgi:hypothetical protein